MLIPKDKETDEEQEYEVIGNAGKAGIRWKIEEVKEKVKDERRRVKRKKNG